MQRIPTDIHLEKGKGIKITTFDPALWHMRFRAFGDKKYSDPESINAVDYISEFTKAELFLFREVCEHTEKNSKLTLRPKSYTPAAQARLKKAIPLWIKRRLLVRIKREYYMVNPWFLTPPKDEQVTAMDYWRALNHH